MQWILTRVEALINRHKFFRRVALVWSMALITWCVHRAFADLDKLTANVTAALATVVGVLTVVIGFYQWSRQNEENDNAP